MVCKRAYSEPDPKPGNRKGIQHNNQSHHLSGKPGNVREFDSCQGNVRDFTKSQGNVRERILTGKSCLKLFIVSCIFVSIQILVGVYCVLNIKSCSVAFLPHH